jgi:hypothetical protein
VGRLSESVVFLSGVDELFMGISSVVFLSLILRLMVMSRSLNISIYTLCL